MQENNRGNSILLSETECVRLFADQIKEEILLMGHSLGALLAIETALLSERVKGLILFSPFARFTETNGYPGQSPKVVRAMRNQLIKHPSKLLQNFYKTMVYPSNLEIKVPESIDSKTLQIGLDFLLTHDIRERIQEVNIPTLIIYGEADKIVNANIPKELDKKFKNSVFYKIKDAGHAVPLTHFNECFQVIKRFLCDKTNFLPSANQH